MLNPLPDQAPEATIGQHDDSKNPPKARVGIDAHKYEKQLGKDQDANTHDVRPHGVGIYQDLFPVGDKPHISLQK